LDRHRRSFLEADASDCRGDGEAVVAPERPQQAAPRNASGSDDLAHRRRRVDAETGSLGEVADAVAGADVVGRLPEEPRLTPGRLLEPERDAQERRLAASVRTGDRDELTRADREIDVLQDERPSGIGERDAIELYDGWQPRPSSSARRFARMRVK
jgi:hypothetical protein